MEITCVHFIQLVFACKYKHIENVLHKFHVANLFAKVLDKLSESGSAALVIWKDA